jgi:hypothetical protein
MTFRADDTFAKSVIPIAAAAAAAASMGVWLDPPTDLRPRHPISSTRTRLLNIFMTADGVHSRSYYITPCANTNGRWNEANT